MFTLWGLGWSHVTWKEMSAKELAIEFRRTLQAQPDLVGRRLRSEWIELRYPLFYRSLGVTWAPPYKDFAKELAQLMPRKRHEARRNGKRVETFTSYLIPRCPPPKLWH
jgi:hypothetical protein